MEFQKYLVNEEITLSEAIVRMTQGGTQILMVVDEERHLQGTVTDGDIRRGILRSVDSSASISEVMFCSPLTVPIDCSPQQAQSLMRARRIHHIPVVDENKRVVGVFTEESLVTEKALPNTAVLMVGGMGTRLRPMTKDCPKPMLCVGGKPILETTIDTLRDAGFRHFVLTTNYLAEHIHDYFGDGSAKGITIEYVLETERLGTAGALRFIETKNNHPILVMNGDILTRLNYIHLLRYHEQRGATATMCVREFNHQIPFGVVELEGDQIRGIQEKPQSSYFVNTGIYVIGSKALQHVPTSGPFDMPDLFDLIRENRMKTIAYPIREYWMDIGRPDDFLQAEKDFAEHFPEL